MANFNSEFPSNLWEIPGGVLHLGGLSCHKGSEGIAEGTKWSRTMGWMSGDHTPGPLLPHTIKSVQFPSNLKQEPSDGSRLIWM